MPMVNGVYQTPCKTCKHKNRLTVLEPCFSCISIESLITPVYGDATYTHYEYTEEQEYE